jgi:hypothetical protein
MATQLFDAVKMMFGELLIRDATIHARERDRTRPFGTRTTSVGMKKGLLLAPVIAMTLSPVCFAGGVFSGTLSSGFANVATTGTYVDWKQSPYFFQDNNPNDANFTVVANANGSSSVSWGTPAPGSFQSSVSFTPVANFGPVAAGVPFEVGTITYTNGTILLGTGTYGANLTITATDPVNGVYAGTTSYVNIDTKNYVDPSPIPALLAPFTAGFANWGQLISADGFILPGIGVLALVKEGDSATFDIMGMVVGDPVIQLTGLTLDSGSVGEGAVIPLSDESVLSSTPEPSTWILFGVGMVGIFAYSRSASRAKSPKSEVEKRPVGETCQLQLG